jgi:hypothetical protein
MATGSFAPGPPKKLPNATAKKRFLEHFRQWGILQTAANYAGVHRVTVWRWQERDPAFSAAFHQAIEQSNEVFEAEAGRRGVEGVEKPVYQGGELVGHVREYSDTLLIFLLKARKPEKYRDRYDVNVRGQTEFVPLSELLHASDRE